LTVHPIAPQSIPKKQTFLNPGWLDKIVTLGKYFKMLQTQEKKPGKPLFFRQFAITLRFIIDRNRGKSLFCDKRYIDKLINFNYIYTPKYLK
jgi:hypothetical protein